MGREEARCPEDPEEVARWTLEFHFERRIIQCADRELVRRESSLSDCLPVADEVQE
jgi:hypothetical protein